jgi:short-subunit dehydrogenase involved in D-alanine esterification of teichoic acids
VDIFAADMSSQAECAVWPLRYFAFVLNHLAPSLLTRLLLDRVAATAPARIVTVSSGRRRAV